MICVGTWMWTWSTRRGITTTKAKLNSTALPWRTSIAIKLYFFFNTYMAAFIQWILLQIRHSTRAFDFNSRRAKVAGLRVSMHVSKSRTSRRQLVRSARPHSHTLKIYFIFQMCSKGPERHSDAHDCIKAISSEHRKDNTWHLERARQQMPK